MAELDDYNRFSDEMYWELYDSILVLVKEKYYDNELINNVSFCYQWMLKEFIYHLADDGKLQNFPKEYYGYLERMDYVINALYSKADLSLKEEDYELQRDA